MIETKLLQSIRRRLFLFGVLLFLSGLTAIPVEPQLQFGLNILPEGTALHQWLAHVLDAYLQTKARFPFLLYGYDWLAFAHFVLAILFIGPYRQPVQNIWVVQFGLIACVLVLPYAFVAGHFRGIPFWWRIADCSFGVFGFLLLWNIRALINRLSLYQQLKTSPLCNTPNM